MNCYSLFCWEAFNCYYFRKKNLRNVLLLHMYIRTVWLLAFLYLFWKWIAMYFVKNRLILYFIVTFSNFFIYCCIAFVCGLQNTVFCMFSVFLKLLRWSKVTLSVEKCSPLKQLDFWTYLVCGHILDMVFFPPILLMKRICCPSSTQTQV